MIVKVLREMTFIARSMPNLPKNFSVPTWLSKVEQLTPNKYPPA